MISTSDNTDKIVYVIGVILAVALGVCVQLVLG